MIAEGTVALGLRAEPHAPTVRRAGASTGGSSRLQRTGAVNGRHLGFGAGASALGINSGPVRHLSY